LETVGIDNGKGYSILDLWENRDYTQSTEKEVEFEVKAHGIVVLKIEGESLPFNVFQFK